jgi:FkbM family methyltransferase
MNWPDRKGAAHYGDSEHWRNGSLFTRTARDYWLHSKWSKHSGEGRSMPSSRRVAVKLNSSIAEAMTTLLKVCIRFPRGERLALSMLRPLRRVVGFSNLWTRLRWTLCRETQGKESGLRWVVLPSGAGVYVHMAELVGSIYFERDSYEPVTTRFVMSHLKAGQTFVDIGGNYGYFSMLAAGIVGPAGKVVAFEANPALQKMIHRSIERNRFQRRVVSADVALSDSDQETVEFYVSTDPNQMGISTMYPWKGHLDAGNLSEQNRIRIRTVRFDSWVESIPLDRIDMMKLDVEGAELCVLRGMGESLRKYMPRYIICETSLEGDVAQYLGQFGYAAEPLELHDPKAQWGNILFVKAASGKR